jgi:hypothetical protein
MDPTFWSLKYVPDDLTQTFAQWNITGAVRQLVSLGQDRFVFQVRGDMDEEPPFAVDETCIVYRNGEGFFYGRVVRISKVAAAGGEQWNFELAGPWWYLDNLPYLQDWNLADDPDDPDSTVSPSARSRVIMFQTLAGTKQSVSEFVGDVLQFAVDAAAPFAIGTVTPGDVEPPYSEIRDQTCGEVVRGALRWAPDAVSWFDYTTTPTPTLHIAARGDLDDVSLSAIGDPVTSVQLTPRPDLQLNGVLILYEAVNSLNELSWTTVTQDSAGSGPFKRAVFTIELGGSSRTVQTQQVTISQINLTSINFWKSLIPRLHQATSVSLSNVRLNGSLLTGQSSDSTDAASGYDSLGLQDFTGSALPPPASTSNLQNVLTAGQVPYWLESHFKDATVAAKISYTLINADTGATEVKEKEVYIAKCKVTDLPYSASAQTFSHPTSYTAAEPIPSGVAAAYLAACSTLHYEGNVSVTEEEASASYRPGLVLNLTDGAEEWEDMDALIQTVSQRLETGETTIQVGPAQHLSPQDFVELQRTQRGRSPSFRLAERVNGQFTGNGSQVQGAIQIVQGNQSAGSAPGKQITLSKKGTSPTTQQVIEAKADASGSATHEVSKTNTTDDLRAQILASANSAGAASHVLKKSDGDGSTLVSKIEKSAGDDDATLTLSWADGGTITAEIVGKVEDEGAYLLLTLTIGGDTRIISINFDDLDSTDAPADVEILLREIDICIPDPEDEESTIPAKMIVLCSEPYVPE